MKKAFLFVVTCGILIFASCDSGVKNSVRNRKYKSLHEEAVALALPDSEVATFPEKYKAQRAAAVILTEYIEQKDSSLKLSFFV